MKRRIKLLAIMGLSLAPLPLLWAARPSGDADFHLLVDRVSSYYKKRPMPFMGLLCFPVNVVNPHGVRNLKLAVFENVDSSGLPKGQDFDAFLQSVAGRSYRPFIRVYDNRSAEQTFIYRRMRGENDFEVLVVSLERTEAVIVEMRLDIAAMSKWVADPASRGRDSAHGGVIDTAR